MSGIPRSRKLWITPLSPVHMGTDEDYTPTGYVIEGDTLYEFDERALENLPAAERRSLDRLLAGEPSPAMLKRVQAFFHRNREWLIPGAVNVVHVSEELAGLYQARIGKTANLKTGDQNKLEIERAAYNPLDRRLMLPGSGLKGAMRTALLDAVKGEKTLKDLSFYDKRDRRKRPPRNNREMQEAIFKGSFATDPMRLVQVGDCAWHGPETLNSAEILFAVNRKKHPVVDERGKLRPALGENLYQLLECAAPFRFRAFRGLLTVPDVRAAGERNGKLPELRFDFGEIAAACNRFYRLIFDREMELLRERGYLDTQWRETVENLLNDGSIRERLDRNDAFLLRVGRHSGAESVTLNGVRSIRIKDRTVDKNIADAIKKAKKDARLHDETILINGEDEIQLPVRLRDLNVTRSGELYYFKPMPKTFWLASGSRGDKRFLRPFGWLLVEMTAPDQAPPPWPLAETLSAEQEERMARWLEQVQQYRRRLVEKVKTIREQEARRLREEAEQKEREERERERLATLSDEERQMEALRRQLEADRAAGRREPGGVLNDKRLALLEAAEQWSDPALRRQAAQLIRETARFLPWAKKRKQEVQMRLERLER